MYAYCVANGNKCIACTCLKNLAQYSVRLISWLTSANYSAQCGKAGFTIMLGEE